VRSAAQDPPQPPLDTASLAEGPYARMRMLWEKTFLKVDVLTLEVRVDPETRDRLAALAGGRTLSKRLADSLAAAVIDTRDAFIRIRFERDVSLKQFLSGVDDNLRKARDAGIIDAAAYDTISAGLPRWFGFLSERGIEDGDRILYRIRGDTLRTVFVSVGGDVLLDQTDVGAERRLAVLGSYFVQGSDFREGLIRSLFRRSG
jgi:hypothetical protein